MEQTFSVELRPRPLEWLLRAVIRKQLAKGVTANLAGLKDYVEAQLHQQE